MRNIEHLLPLPNFSFVHQDVTEYIHVSGPLHHILHFASPASPIDYLKIPIQTLKVGSLGVHRCLGLAEGPKERALPSPRPVKFMATPKFILNTRSIGAT